MSDVSTKFTVEYSKDFHLYTDFMDEFGGPHAYLRIGNDLVKQLLVVRGPGGLSVTLRIPPEIFSLLRADLAHELQDGDRYLDRRRFLQGLRRFRKAGSKKRRVPPGRTVETSS